jgi:hypothetical protein
MVGLVASVPACWRALSEIAAGGSRPLAQVTAAAGTGHRGGEYRPPPGMGRGRRPPRRPARRPHRG